MYGCDGRSYRASRVRHLDDLAQVHHGDAVADVAHDRQVVGDEQVRQAELALQVLEQVDDLRLDRHVERRHRLVADDQLRVQAERPGDADALALAAGELVRDSGWRARASPTRSSSACTRLPLPLAHEAVDAKGSRDDRRAPSGAGSGARRGPGRRSASRAAPPQRARPDVVMSSPSNVSSPPCARAAAGPGARWCSCRSPISPTSARVSPWRTSKLTPSTALTAPILRWKTIPRDREVLDQIAHLHERLRRPWYRASSRLCPRQAHRGLRLLGHPPGPQLGPQATAKV